MPSRLKAVQYRVAAAFIDRAHSILGTKLCGRRESLSALVYGNGIRGAVCERRMDL